MVLLVVIIIIIIVIISLVFLIESSLEDNMDLDRQGLEPKLVSLSLLRRIKNDICITQFYPAWSLHALLRFCNISYECSNCDINTSLGMILHYY